MYFQTAQYLLLYSLKINKYFDQTNAANVLG